MYNNSIGDTLLRLRTKAGESQEEVADATDIARVTYTRYESNQREPKATAALKLAQHFGVTVEFLYGIDSLPSESMILSQIDREILGILHDLNAEGQQWLLTSAHMAKDNAQFAKPSTASEAI